MHRVVTKHCVCLRPDAANSPLRNANKSGSSENLLLSHSPPPFVKLFFGIPASCPPAVFSHQRDPPTRPSKGVFHHVLLFYRPCASALSLCSRVTLSHRSAIRFTPARLPMPLITGRAHRTADGDCSCSRKCCGSAGPQPAAGHHHGTLQRWLRSRSDRSFRVQMQGRRR